MTRFSIFCKISIRTLLFENIWPFTIYNGPGQKHTGVLLLCSIVLYLWSSENIRRGSIVHAGVTTYCGVELYLLLCKQNKKGKSVLEYLLPNLPMINLGIHFGKITKSTYLSLSLLGNIFHFLLVCKPLSWDTILNRTSNRAGTKYFLSISNKKISGQRELPH